MKSNGKAQHGMCEVYGVGGVSMETIDDSEPSDDAEVDEIESRNSIMGMSAAEVNGDMMAGIGM